MSPADKEAPRWADCYCALVAQKSDDVAGLRAALTAAPPGAVLELGAGFGRLAVVAAETGRQVVAVEPSGMMLGYRDVFFREVPGDVRERITWRVADARETGALPQDAGRYAVVVCGYNGLNEITDGLAEMIDGAARVLAPGGLLYLDWRSDRYERAGVVELYDYVEVFGERWAVYTIVQERDGDRHDLTLIYERISADAAGERFYQVLERRSWQREDVRDRAAAAGLDHHGELSRGNVMVFVKRSDAQNPDRTTAEDAEGGDAEVAEVLVEEVSIDGMCGVY